MNQNATLYQQPHSQQHINHNSAHFHVPRQSHPNQHEQAQQQWQQQASYYQPLSNLCENANLSVGYQQNQQNPTHTLMSAGQVPTSCIAATSTYPFHQSLNIQSSTPNIPTSLYNTPTPPYPLQPNRHNHPYVSRLPQQVHPNPVQNSSDNPTSNSNAFLEEMKDMKRLMSQMQQMQSFLLQNMMNHQGTQVGQKMGPMPPITY